MAYWSRMPLLFHNKRTDYTVSDGVGNNSHESGHEEQSKGANQELPSAIRNLINEKQADIFVISGPIGGDLSESLAEFFDDYKPVKPNVIVFLCTLGGLADDAYVIARTFQRAYKKFSLYVAGFCKSAGTLIALGADEIVLGTKGELGPLDVQIPKEDSLVSRASGLDSGKSIGSLQNRAFDDFEAMFLKLVIRSGGVFSTQTAARIATDLVVGLLAPIAEQIDPLKFGENQRALDVSRKYGEQLGANRRKFDRPVVDRLVDEYPSHSHAIDYEEASRIFKDDVDVGMIPLDVEKSMQEIVGEDCIRWPSKEVTVLPILIEEEQSEVTQETDSDDSESVMESGEDVAANDDDCECDAEGTS